jgi:hypothetical protein
MFQNKILQRLPFSRKTNFYFHKINYITLLQTKMSFARKLQKILAGTLQTKEKCLVWKIKGKEKQPNPNQGEETQPPSLLSPPGLDSVRLCSDMETELPNCPSLPQSAS